MVRVLDSCAEDHGSGTGFGTHLEPLVGGSPTVHPAAIGDPVETLVS